MAAHAINGRTTYQAKIVKPDGYALEATSVNFRFTVLDPSGSCIIYVEDYTAINMANTGGLISFSLGSGVRSFPSSGTTFAAAFDNSTTSMACQTSGAYNPLPTDNRKVVMQFHDGGGWQTLPAMAVNAVPYAMYATKSQDSQKLNNKADTAFVEYSTLAGLGCAADQAIKFNGASFSCITVGSSGGGGITGVSTSGTVLTTGGTASAPVISITAASMSADGYLTSVDYAEFKAKLGASQTQIVNTLGFAPVSGAAVSSQISTALDSAATSSNTVNTIVKRDSSGNFIANDIFANSAKVNYVDIYKPSTNFSVRLQAPTSLAANYNLVLPNDDGTTGQILSTDGSGNLTWINSSTGSVTNVSATAPLSSTGGSTPTISITPATSTTSGYLSNTDFSTFNNKQNQSAELDAISATAALGILQRTGAATYSALGLSSDMVVSGSALALSATGVSAGTYTKVTVDVKGRVTSGAQLASSDVTTALGYTPVSASASSQWNTSGTTINYVAGNVGIGTTSPVTKLEVSGTIKATSFQGNGSALTGISVTPAGSSGQLQFNNGGVLGATAAITAHATNPAMTISGNSPYVILDSDSTAFPSAGLQLKTNNLSRWQLHKFGAETGGGAGSDLGFHPGNDGGGFIGSTPTYIFKRASAGFSIGTTATPINGMDVNGNVAIGSYAGVNTAPTGGLIVAGNVGIGTTNPGYKLEVSGSVYALGEIKSQGGLSDGQFGLSGNGTGTLVLRSTNATAPHIQFIENSSGNRGQIGFPAGSSDFVVKLGGANFSAGTERFRVANSGNVGIGTTAPITKLEVSGGVRIGMESAVCAVSYAGTLRYNSGNVEFCNGSSWAAFGVSSSGLTSLNGSTSQTQTFANGSTGNAPAFVTANGVHTLNIPLASAGSVTAGLLSNADYVSFSNKITSSAASIAQVLGYVPASATGTLAAARLPAFFGDVTSVSGSAALTVAKIQSYSVSSTAPTSGQVLTFNSSSNSWAPAAPAASSQWNTSGTTINYIAGNVGIGTDAPTAKLDVSGTIRISGGSPGLGKVLISDATGLASWSSSISGTMMSTNNLSDLASATVARTNLGLGALATLGFIDLSTSFASGTLAVARMPAFVGDVTSSAASNTLILANSGVTASTYAKVTVDAKGRVTSGSALTLSDVTTGLGYTPANSATTVSSQWATSGTNISFISGNVGIGAVVSGTASKLKVTGTIAGNTNVISSGGAVNLALSNTHVLQSVGSSTIALSNLENGAAYTLIVTDATSRQYTFTGCTSYFGTANAVTTTSTRTIYGITTIYNSGVWECYVSWSTGFQ